MDRRSKPEPPRHRRIERVGRVRPWDGDTGGARRGGVASLRVERVRDGQPDDEIESGRLLDRTVARTCPVAAPAQQRDGLSPPHAGILPAADISDGVTAAAGKS